MEELQSYLPTKPSLDEVRELSNSTGMGLAHSKATLMRDYNSAMKDGLQCALGDYLCCPAEYGESFLAEIMSEMLTLI